MLVDKTVGAIAGPQHRTSPDRAQGAVVNRALTIKSGQTHVQRYLRPLLQLIEEGRIDPSFVVSHRLTLDQAPQGYAMFRDKQDECIKVVLKPGQARASQATH
jgi:threonine dehydrogenase-like Zn-dependent dehydrogenase